jgi:citrate lyase beta subunit
MSRPYSQRWKDFREALDLMQTDDELIWDVPELHTARSTVWLVARRNGWILTTRVMSEVGDAGRLYIKRHKELSE